MVSDGAARLVAAFNAHDLDAVMSFFVDDPVLELPRGPHPWGQRFQGPEEVRSGLASRFAGLPDVHDGEDRHWVSGDRRLEARRALTRSRDQARSSWRHAGCVPNVRQAA